MDNVLKEIVKGENCVVCSKWIHGYEHVMCCDGRECGCMGMPIHPCVCSQECADKFSADSIENSKHTRAELNRLRDIRLSI